MNYLCRGCTHSDVLLSADADGTPMSERVLVRTRFDPSSNRSVAVAVAEALSLVAELSIDLPPLAHSIDTDSLDGLFGSGASSPPPVELRLTFPYEQWQVTVAGTGEIVVGVRPGYELAHD